MTERDLSIAQTIPVSHPVIMGFITQACTSLMLSLHLSLSLCTYAHSSHTPPHTYYCTRAGSGRLSANRIYGNSFFLFFSSFCWKITQMKINGVNAYICLFDSVRKLFRVGVMQKHLTLSGLLNILGRKRKSYLMTVTLRISTLIIISLKAACICT